MTFKYFFWDKYLNTSKFMTLLTRVKFILGLCFLQWMPAKGMLCMCGLNLVLSSLLLPSKKMCSGFGNSYSCPVFLSSSLPFYFCISVNLLRCSPYYFCPCDSSNSQCNSIGPQSSVLKMIRGYVNGVDTQTFLWASALLLQTVKRSIKFLSSILCDKLCVDLVVVCSSQHLQDCPLLPWRLERM